MGLLSRETGGDGRYRVGQDGVRAVHATADGKVDFIVYADRTDAFVRSQMGYPAVYPVLPVRITYPVKAVLMDLDGTTVHSEHFWVWIIEQTTACLLEDPGFRLGPEDLPFVSGHSVSEHLQYCIAKYCPNKTVEEGRSHYFEITRREMKAIEEGHGRDDAFTPSPGVRAFLLALKARGIRIAVVSSGLYEKAWPELLAAFRALGFGDPVQFYDAIVTAGFPIRAGRPGTLGELEAKPHPWLYAEAARVGLGMDVTERHHVIGIEDSGAGVVAIRLAGFAVLGMPGGNIEGSGTGCLLSRACKSFDDALRVIDGEDT